MTDRTGQFFWYELMTSDPTAAETFYKAVVGWTAEPFGGDPAMPYTVISGSAGAMGGIMGIPPEAEQCGMKPWWGGYIASADVDADAERLTKAGAEVRRPAEDIPGVGRFAVIGDPGDATFMLLKGESDEEMPAPPPMATGHVAWHELHSSDAAASVTFLREQFGWTLGDAMDMGPMGTYQLMSMTGGSTFPDMTGAVMPKPEQMPVANWLFYFSVPDIDAAADKVKTAGGTVIMGPMEVPGGGWIVQALDPQGAMFALVGSRTT